MELSYYRSRNWRDRRIVRWFTGLPHWVIGLGLLTPLWVFWLFRLEHLFWRRSQESVASVNDFLLFAVVFMPGAVRRLEWRHVLVMLGLAGAVFAADKFIPNWSWGLPFPYSHLPWPMMNIAVIGISEWLLIGRRSRLTLLWIIVLSIAGAAVTALIRIPLALTGTEVSIPEVGGPGVQHVLSLPDLLYWPLPVVLTWLAVPAAIALGKPSSRRAQMAGGGLVLAAAAAFLFFFHIALYPLVRQSLTGRGVFSRVNAFWVLQNTSNAPDVDLMWTTLARADWSEWGNYGNRDYRKVCINSLAKGDRKPTAERLSKMLRDKPSGVLAALSAELLAKEQRYEAVPILMRYALHGNDDCTTALESMKIPQVALVVLSDAMIWDRQEQATGDFPISQPRRERLSRLLGKDVGLNYSQWSDCYDSVINQLPTPLTTAGLVETNRVVQAMGRYFHALNWLNRGKDRLFVERLRKDGMSAQVDDLVARTLRARQSHNEIDTRGLDPAFLAAMDNYQTRARRDMEVKPPDWNAPDTAALEREVAEYAKRVDAMIAKYAVPVTRPAKSVP